MRDEPVSRKVVHPQAHDNYRVILKCEGDEVEIGSIGIRHNGWSLGIDTVIAMRAHEIQGEGNGRRDCMRRFKAAWERFAADEVNLIEFLNGAWCRIGLTALSRRPVEGLDQDQEPQASGLSARAGSVLESPIKTTVGSQRFSCPGRSLLPSRRI